jgi:hypothetical protein
VLLGAGGKGLLPKLSDVELGSEASLAEVNVVGIAVHVVAFGRERDTSIVSVRRRDDYVE